MPLSPKKHGKLNNSKHAAVSLDSFLGVLSSAYGTEQLDSSIIFEKDRVNWSNISVEHLQALNRKEETSDKAKKDKVKEERVSTATSTSNLRPGNVDEEEIDETLYSIRSLVSLQQVKSKPHQDKREPPQEVKEGGAAEVSSSQQANSEGQMEDPKATGDNLKTNQTRLTPVCGFYVDDSNHRVVFDIQFVKRASILNQLMPVFELGEPEILINIHDIAKPMSASLKVAKCNLVSKVNYFADVEKEFGLENLDVNVKCNFGVFQWVIQWIMSDIPMCRPNLNVTNLKAILSLANHLGINQLVEECLDFFRENLNMVLENDQDIEEIFDDKLILNFTKRFTNIDIDKISNDFEGMKTKLFCTLIKMLADPEPDQKIGHYYSLVTMFQCGFCEKILHISFKDYIPCRADLTKLTVDGRLEYYHECSSFWNLSRYIEAMYEELKDWRLVYWQLWGMCHYFYCEVCQTWYPLSQSDWCPYHPGEVEYFPIKNNQSHPIGTYGCCGENAFRFNVIKPHHGCKYTSHVSKLDTMEKVEIFNIHQELKQVINIPTPLEQNIKKFTKLLKADEISSSNVNSLGDRFCWSGILLAPEEKKDYSLIPSRVLNILRNRPEAKKEPKKHFPLKFGSNVPFGSILPPREKENEIQELPLTARPQKKSRPKFTVKKGKSSTVSFGLRGRTKKKKSLSYMYQPVESVWTDLETNKDNQDNQRDYEEIAMRKLVQMLSPGESGVAGESEAGSYIRLESEWWQRNCRNVDKTSSTVVNRTFPLSWFRRLTI